MIKIYKYPLMTCGVQSLKVKGFQEFIKVGEQDGVLCIWCIVNKEDESIYTAKITIVGTGNPMTGSTEIIPSSYFDTVLMADGLVWHVFISY